ncbi:MAG TPA: PD-(D/E)XK nuclease family protein [Gaiellaceae bacterium]|nr:PD-(D/E)XK nuclease family protein [Gaiellaceae bacterium]
MPLTLLAGPANAGKVALLLERYLAALADEPFLIVPNRSDVDRVERELLSTFGALMAGEIGTFDDLFERLAREGGEHLPIATDAQRTLIIRTVIAGPEARLNGWARSARFSGFADALAATLGELESGLVDPGDLDGDLAGLYAEYRAELHRLGLWDRDLQRRAAAERVGSELAAWEGRPVFAYGFEDLTGAQWALLEALSGRGDVTVSLPYEPGRPAFASLERTARDLSELARPAIEELPARPDVRPPALAHLERALFSTTGPAGPPIDGSLRFLEGAGRRGTLELVAEELLDLIRGGTRVEDIALVCPRVERYRASLETALGSLGVPYAIEGRIRFDQTEFGRALLSLLRFAWLDGGRRELYGFLRSPYSGLARASVDWIEGRLRGRAVEAGARTEEETIRLRDGHPLPPLELLRKAQSPLVGLDDLGRFMLRSAYGLESPPVGEESRRDLRAFEALTRLVDELEGWLALGGSLAPDEIVAVLERSSVRSSGPGEPGRVDVVDLLRARTRRYEVVFVLGLEEGTLPRRGETSPFLDDEAARELDARLRRSRLAKPDPVERDRYLFYTACTRATQRLYLVREAASDDGAPREPSPFVEEVRGLFADDEVRRATTRRPLSALTWPIEQAPTDRERLRALASLAPVDDGAARSLALANGWERRLDRAQRAFERPTRLTHTQVLAELSARTSFGVTELETFADCSSIWFVDRVIGPRTIDQEVDARLRGQVAHSALHKLFAGVPKRLGVEKLGPEQLDDALELLRECLGEAMEGVRMELTDLQRRELEQGLLRDLEQFLRDEAASELQLVPRRFEVSFGSDRSPQELQRGLDLGTFRLSGKIDRIDLDPFSARGIVQDYKSGKTAHSAAQIESELKLQIPLYMLVLRDLIGVEPLGGIYRALSGKRDARGLLRAEAKEDGVPGFSRNDYLDEETFWGQVERAQELARGFVDRIRGGDVRHDPKGGDCPPWCELWRMCRVRRA